MSYHYSAYGLNFFSMVELPELIPIANPGKSLLPDVEILTGEITAAFDGPVTSGPFFQATQTECVLTTPEGSQYWLQSGSRAIICPSVSSPNDVVRYFLIYGALPILLIQRGIFLLHGSAVSDGERVLVLLGASRSGKSTLAAGLLQRGWRLISDELVVCNLDSTQRVFIQPGIPQILLWRNAFEQLKLNTNTGRHTRIPNQFLLSVGKRFESESLTIRMIVCLERTHNDGYHTIEKLENNFSQVLKNRYLPLFPKPQPPPVAQAQLPMILAATTPIKTILWNSRQYAVSNLLDAILEQMG